MRLTPLSLMNYHQKFRKSLEPGGGLISGLMWLNEVLVLLTIFYLTIGDEFVIDFGLSMVHIVRFRKRVADWGLPTWLRIL